MELRHLGHDKDIVRICLGSLHVFALRARAGVRTEAVCDAAFLRTPLDSLLLLNSAIIKRDLLDVGLAEEAAC